jgi:hypothetical protein
MGNEPVPRMTHAPRAGNECPICVGRRWWSRNGGLVLFELQAATVSAGLKRHRLDLDMTKPPSLNAAGPIVVSYPNLRPFPKGTWGNPFGKGGLYHEAMVLAGKASTETRPPGTLDHGLVGG